MKIAHIVATRPNFIKAMPVIKALKEKRFNQYIIHTGQHYDPKMSSSILNEIRFPKIDVNLNINKGSMADQVGSLMPKLREELLGQGIELLIVYGDVNATMAAAIVGSHLHIPIVHIEAGLRSRDESMPEELNRKITDVVSSYMFTTSKDANENLVNEGVSKSKMFLVGNTMIDTLKLMESDWNKSEILNELGLRNLGYCLVTLHRPSNVDKFNDLKRSIDIVNQISKYKDVVFPVHPRTHSKLVETGLIKRFRENVLLLDPVSYLPFIKLINSASFVITDSGGIQEETSALGVPCFTMRNNTERPITIELGSNELIGENPGQELIRKIVTNVPKVRARCNIPLWDGNAATRIANKIFQLYEK